jgi:hypothetical protein
MPEYFEGILKHYRDKKVRDIAFETFETDLQRVFKAFLKLFYPEVAFKNHCTLCFVEPTSSWGNHLKDVTSIGLTCWSYETHSTIFILEDPFANDAESTMLHYWHPLTRNGPRCIRFKLLRMYGLLT